MSSCKTCRPIFVCASPQFIAKLTLISQFLPAHSTLSATPTPPTDPPPAPPPLNLPPSRARRQLAARLALHSQQKTEVSSNTDEPATSPRKGIAHNDGGNDDDVVDDQHRWNSEEMTHHELFLGKENENVHQAEEDGVGSIPEVGESRKPPTAVVRHLDLDDFANSPAADADDTAEEDSGDDVEMKIALG